MGTTVQKLQRILETKTGFKDLITEKGGVITETTTFHEYIDEARKLMEGGKVVVEEASATAVPNEGYVEEVYFNTNLTSEEVDKIITEANLEWAELSGIGGLTYVAMLSISSEHWVTIHKIDDLGYNIRFNLEHVIYTSDSEKSLDEIGFVGWNPDLSSDSFDVLQDVMSSADGVNIGHLNEALKMLIASTPFSTGKQPVPNSGYVDAIKFNTSLTPEEVDKIIVDANLDFVNMSNSSVSSYVVVLEDTQNNIMIANIGPAIGVDNAYIIQLLSTDLEDYDTYVYISPAAAEASGAPISGWGIDSDFVFNMMAEVVSEYEYDDGKVAPVGLQNDKLIDLFYIGSEPFKKELTGTYEAVTVDVTENSEVDLTTYWDNQQMPIKVNVNVESEGEPVVVKAEETRSAVPNSGYLDTVYFNTDLTSAEIDEVITNANMSWSVNGYAETLFVTENLSLNILVMNMAVVSNIPGYCIVNMKTSEFIYVSQEAYNAMPGQVPFVGWNPSYINGYVVKQNVVPELAEGSESLTIGVYNEVLKDILYIKDGFNYEKTLAGNYEALNINITDNQNIKFDSYFDNKQIPVQLNVNVASSGSLKALLDHTKSTSYLFSNWTDVTEYTSDHIAFDATSNVENMDSMFYKCTKLTRIPLFDTSKVTIMTDFLFGCNSLIEVPNFDLSNVTKLDGAFWNCTSLEFIPDFNTSNVVDFSDCFRGCTSLKEVTLSHVGKATKLDYIFYECTNLEKVVLGSVYMANYYSAFTKCENLTELTVLDIANNLSLKDSPKLTTESLIGICKECVSRQNAGGTAIELTLNEASIEKLANVYVKFTDPSITEILPGEKGDVEVCESTDEGAMTISAYMALKNWTLVA